jgi:hypothetical protein
LAKNPHFTHRWFRQPGLFNRAALPSGELVYSEANLTADDQNHEQPVKWIARQPWQPDCFYPVDLHLNDCIGNSADGDWKL